MTGSGQVMNPIHAERPAATRPDPIPVTILTGFLGSGKTTFLNRLLRDPDLGRTVVIINEFGETGIDHDLIESTSEDTILLSSGCLCCTVRDDLISTFEDLLRRRDNGRIAPFDRVVIETTGLADPAPVLHTIMGHKYLAMRYRLEGIITLVDAVNGADTLFQHVEAVKQVAVADRILLAKGDLASSLDIAAIKSQLARLNPGAEFVDLHCDPYPGGGILDCGLYNPDSKQPDVRRWLNEEALAELYASHEGHAHTLFDSDKEPLKPDVNRHSEDIRAFSFTSPVPVSRQAYEVFSELLRSAHGTRLLRVKGIVYLKDQPEQPLVIQGAQHIFHAESSLSGWPSVERSTRLVFIVRDLKKAFIEKLWNALTA